jgi:Dna[CI] antecedent, DciA
MRKNDFSLAEALQMMLREYRLKPQLDETKLRMVWERVMGKTIATYTAHISVRKNVLHLTILSAPLKHELSYAKDKICILVNEAMGDGYIKDVVIR